MKRKNLGEEKQEKEGNLVNRKKPLSAAIWLDASYVDSLNDTRRNFER
jgi:hypothetical protein